MLETAIPLDQSDIRLYEPFLHSSQADYLYTQLSDYVDWTQPEITLYGRKVKSPRLAAWYGDDDAIYRYSGLTNYPSPWTPELLEVKNQIQLFLGAKFNSVLLNLYRSGEDAMGWHSDNEKELGDTPVIASLSLGATRRFLFRRRDAQPRGGSTGLNLRHGSLLVMAGNTQRNWQHSISRTKKPTEPRINLTFRQVFPL
ncbi:MAG: alpha-ketoglutarate-dependent dioxygenase AlkB [Acidiferrobacterales bacterium]|nr:alpha-ketoglutarate-dependent dioxygenase AlkB [Acidiferrobacterales bacterium]